MTPGARAQAVELVKAWNERLTVHVPAEQRGLLIIDIDEAIQAAVEAERERAATAVEKICRQHYGLFVNKYVAATMEHSLAAAICQEGDPS